VINGSFRTSDGFGASEAASWVKELPAGPERVAGVQALASLQLYNNPGRADSIPEAWPAGPERDAALRGIATSISQNEPARAFEFARRINNPDSRSNAFVQIARSWLYRNESAARAWISTTPELFADDKRVLIRQFDER
jgi:hypothetical protein